MARDALRLQVRTEPLVPIPTWRWSAKEDKWVVARMVRPRGSWMRPVLPRIPNVDREGTRAKWAKGRKLATPGIMHPKDWERAQVVLSVYLRSMKIESWEELQLTDNYRYALYPATEPPGYPAHHRLILFCCSKGEKPWKAIPDSRVLENPVTYLFCRYHWYDLLRKARGQRSLRYSVPDLEPEIETEAKGDTTSTLCPYRHVESTNSRVYLTNCALEPDHRGKHRSELGSIAWDARPLNCDGRVWIVPHRHAVSCARPPGHRGPHRTLHPTHNHIGG